MNQTQKCFRNFDEDLTKWFKTKSTNKITLSPTFQLLQSIPENKSCLQKQYPKKQFGGMFQLGMYLNEKVSISYLWKS